MVDIFRSHEVGAGLPGGAGRGLGWQLIFMQPLELLGTL